MPQPPSPASPKVVLNIGGHRYETSKATLTKVRRCYFTRLLDGEVAAVKEADGAIFLDRDGEYFSCILQWMRAWDPSQPFDKATSVLLQFRKEDWRRLSELTGLPSEVYSDTRMHRALVTEVKFYELTPMLFLLEPTHPSLTGYDPSVESGGKWEEVEAAIREWEGESHVPDISLVQMYQKAPASRTGAVPAAVPGAAASTTAASGDGNEEAVLEFDAMGGFGALLEGVKASLLGRNAEVTWAPPAGFDISKHGAAIAKELKRRYGLPILLLDDCVQLSDIVSH